MFYSSVDYCNRALLRLGASAINSFEDGTTEAEACKVLYPQVRDYLLASHPWTFAEAKSQLDRHATAVSGEFDYSFELPLDCIRVVGVVNDTSMPSYRVIGRAVATDAAECEIVYIRRVPEQWFPPFFQKALVSHLAAELAVPVTEDEQRARALLEQADLELRRARLNDAQQDTPRVLQDNTLLAVHVM